MSYHILIYSEGRKKHTFIKNLLNALITSTKDGKRNKKWNNELKMKKDKKHQTSQETDINSKNTSINQRIHTESRRVVGEIV